MERKALQTNIQLMEGMSNRVLEGTNGGIELRVDCSLELG